MSFFVPLRPRPRREGSNLNNLAAASVTAAPFTTIFEWFGVFGTMPYYTTPSNAYDLAGSTLTLTNVSGGIYVGSRLCGCVRAARGLACDACSAPRTNQRPTAAAERRFAAWVLGASPLWRRLLTAGSDATSLADRADALAFLDTLPSVCRVAIGLVLADLCLYGVHRAMHASDLLWRTHVFHHSIEQLYWLSGARTSVTHLFLFAIPQVFLSHVLLNLSATEAAAGFSIGAAVNIWVHINVRADLGPLRHWIVTPDFHRVHHAKGDLSRKNLGFILTLWDRIFGTYVDPRSLPRDFPLGLVDPDEEPLGRMIVGV